MSDSTSHYQHKYSVIRVVFLLFLSLLCLQHAHGASKPEEMTIRLSSFSTAQGPIRLHGTAESFDLYLSRSGTVRLHDTWIELALNHSIALMRNRSSVRVLFNDSTLAQIPYNPDQPLAKARVRIPADSWRSGFNKLTFSVIQHYTDRCEDDSAPELWTEIDLHNSLLGYSQTQLDRPLELRDLSGLFSPGIGGFEQVSLLSPASDDLDTQSYLNEALPLVAQAIALRRDYAPLKVAHARWRESRKDMADRSTHSALLQAAPYLPDGHQHGLHVLIGTADKLGDIVSPDILSEISGPFLQLGRTSPLHDKDNKLIQPAKLRLIVSGNTPDEVVTAARVLAEMDDRLNAISRINVMARDRRNEQLPLASGFFLQPNKQYRFAELGHASTTMQGSGTRRVSVNLPISGDFYTIESASAEILLDFAYSAGMGSGSVMSVFLNGEYLHGLTLKETDGVAFRDYRIQFPARKLVPGMNTLNFDFSLRTESVTGECRDVPGSHLLAQLLDSSRIVLPKASPVATLPNLANLAATAFPYISSSHQAKTSIVTANEELMGSALSIAGKLAQLANAPADHLKVYTHIPQQPTGNTILIGTPEDMPGALFDSLNVSLERSYRWPYRMLNALRENSPISVANASPDFSGSISQDRGLGTQAVMLALRNPYDSSPSTITVLAADSHPLLVQRIDDLLTPQLWGQLSGDLVVWEHSDSSVQTMRVGNYYEVGEQSMWHRLMLTLSNNPWYWVAALLITLLIVASISHTYLRRREMEKLAE